MMTAVVVEGLAAEVAVEVRSGIVIENGFASESRWTGTVRSIADNTGSGT